MSWTPRLQGRPRLTAAVLVAATLLALWGVLAGTSIADRTASKGDRHTDLAMYDATIERMNHGASYYAAVAVELPAGNYPTRPAMNVREPTLARFITTVGRPAAVATMLALAIAALILTLRTFELTERGRAAWVAAVVCGAAGVGILCRPAAVAQHEVWAALLVYTGVMCRGHGWVRTSVALLLAAAFVRELVAPVIVIMLVLALRERGRREAGLWAAALAAFALYYGIHWWNVQEMHGAAGPPAPGWVRFGGWPFAVDAMWGSSLLTVFPHAVAAIVVPLALLGWLSRAGVLFDRVGAVLVAYVALFCVAGRPDNFYWGMLIEALLLPGVVFGVQFLLIGMRLTRRPIPRHTIEISGA